jgi:G3E family GTPase
MPPKTPITLVTGSLGSGKTTLLKRIIEASDQRLAVLMNEFGEIGIDSRVIKAENFYMIELTGGCVCCELTGEFEAAVRELLQTVSPERIVVEATGVAESDALVYEVEDNLPQMRLDGVICLVDAYTSIRFPEFGYVGRTQLEAADLILLNKTDLVTDEEAASVEGEIRRFNDTAAILRTVRGKVAMDLLFGPNLAQPSGSPGRRVFSPAEHRHGEEFQSVVFAAEGLFKMDCFKDAVDRLPDKVLRAKGFLCTPAGTYLFNYVAGKWELEEFPAERADRTLLVFIGKGLAAEEAGIVDRLRRCEA